MKKDILQTEHSIEKEVQIVTKKKKYNIIEATVELHRENDVVKKQKYGLYKAGLLLEHPILLQGLGPLPCLMLSTGVLIDHTCLSQILAIGFLYIFYIKSIKKRTLTDTRTQMVRDVFIFLGNLVSFWWFWENVDRLLMKNCGNPVWVYFFTYNVEMKG